MASQSKVIVYSPQDSLKYPEAHVVFESLKAFICAQEGANQVTALVLECTKVEYVDYTGVQTLIAVKDFLASLTGWHVPIHFYNMKPEFMNRLIRISTYCPRRPSLPEEPSPEVPSSPASLSRASSSTGGSPFMESLPSPYDFPPELRRKRSSSLSIANARRPSQSQAPAQSPTTTQAPPPVLRSRSSKGNLNSDGSSPSIRRSPSNSQGLRAKSSLTSIVPTQEPSTKPVEMQRQNSVGAYLKKLRQKSSQGKVGQQNGDLASDDENPFHGSTVAWIPEDGTVKSVLRHSRSNSSIKSNSVMVDEEAMSHFPTGNAKGLKYFHTSREEAVAAAGMAISF
ncbi:UNVERIFIED_CONTAM: hypothetical protein HDU68_008053 [Siphonaria sp. JEL0065]|nr:hypothetical protein HDU68_008053 [Siphonaria sp. JEL0065]